MLKESYRGDACHVISPNTVKTRLPYELGHAAWQKIQTGFPPSKHERYLLQYLYVFQRPMFFTAGKLTGVLAWKDSASSLKSS